MVDGGLSAHEGLAAATSGSARALGLTDAGTIEAGNVADLVVLNSNPLVDIKTVMRPDEIWTVVSAGRLVFGPPTHSAARGESIATGV